jgi:hypothetical protein
MKRVFLVLSVLWSILATPAQTADCRHVSNTVGYYDGLRAIVGNVSDLRERELTLVSKGKDQVAVRVFHLTNSTDYYKKTDTTIHRLEFSFLRDHRNGLWCVMYCYYCRQVYAVTKLEF